MSLWTRIRALFAKPQAAEPPWTKGRVVTYVTNCYGKRAPLILAFIEVESSFNPRAYRADRNGGSYGLMQLDLPTARDRGFRGGPNELYDPAVNIRLGVAQLDWISAHLRARSSYGLDQLAAAYNEGVGAVDRGIADPDYVGRVATALSQWKLKLTGSPA